jgi:hypothetical protein
VTVVSDATPLIALAQLGQLDLLRFWVGEDVRRSALRESDE